MANSVHGSEDRITLVLGGAEVLLAERYQVKTSILTQPSGFSIDIGDNDTAAKILKKYRPGTPFQLLINDTVYQTGRIDGRGTSGAGTKVSLKGRDMLAELHDGMVDEDRSFKDISYADLVRKNLDLAGLEAFDLAYSNEANRKAITGGKVRQLAPPRDVTQEKVEVEGGGTVKREVQAHLGERRYEFLRRHLDPAGLFLWAAADGSFVLSEPNPHQAPLYALVRNYEKPFGSNIEHEEFNDDTTHRYAQCSVFGKGSKKGARVGIHATATDLEMVELGYVKELIVKDTSVDSVKKAVFSARRKLAETRRNGWSLEYTVKGHTTAALAGGIGKKVAWAPDTIVTVYDDKLDFRGVDFYVEEVTFASEPQTIAKLRLMRLGDLIFSDTGGPLTVKVSTS